MTSESRHEARGDALRVFAAWLSRRESGDTYEFAELLRLHPPLAADLDAIHSAWRSFAEARDLLLASRSFRAEITERFGEEADPGVSLHGARTAISDADPALGRISELAARAGVFGRYRIEGEVARGGMGSVLRVWDEDLRRRLAMKVVLDEDRAFDKPGPASSRTRAIARFIEEAQVTGQLDHPGIVPVHELGLDKEGRVYFTMKLVEGRDLKQIFGLVFEGREGWNETRALGVILKVCEAVAYAHRKGVIHRDLKPSNVMIGNFGEAYVMDWGLARVLGRKDLHDLRLAPDPGGGDEGVRSDRREALDAASRSPLVTLEGAVVGTPAYMPPEQARGETEKLSPRSDVYSIGAMLYHLLGGRMPYAPDGARLDHRSVLARLLAGPPRPLHELNAGVPAELAAICEKAMARDAEDRYADTLALAEDLRAYLEHRVVGAYETGAVAELRKWVGRNQVLAAALGAAVLALIAGLTTSLVFKARADERATDLSAARNVAQQKANDVLSLSAIREWKDLEDRADALWPAEPETLPRYEAWIADARLLIDGRPGDPARGIKKRPSLADHQAKLAELRLRSKPLTPEQIEEDRRASPGYAEWQRDRGARQWILRMLGDESWPSESEVEAELSNETLPTDAPGLNELAWKLVDTDRAKMVFGGEVRGLVLARRALAAASDSERAGIRDTLGRALYRTGRFDEAVAETRRAADEATGSLKDELTETAQYMKAEEERLWTTPEGRARSRENAAKNARRMAELEGGIGERRTYEFEDADDRWWHAQLSSLVSALKALEDESSGGLDTAGVSRQHGWGILKRVEFARDIAQRSVDGEDAKRRWSEAVDAVAASPKYGGLKLTPQLGLLPIGADPDSGFSEFVHLETGDPPERGPDGKLILQESTGLVFVLLPGGEFEMGAQRTDPTGENYDPNARDDESPVHAVKLSPFLLSKFEMTQGQWERFTGHNPSGLAPPTFLGGRRINLLHPVEHVSWTQCMETMTRMALTLSSEAQWEYACRAGTNTPWWTGADRESLRGKVNLADQSAMRNGERWSEIADWPDLDDGWAMHAVVGTFPANPFGMHEMHGNVWEWCLDGTDLTFYPKGRRIDPVAPVLADGGHKFRGGSFSSAAPHARSANRYESPAEYHQESLGLRPARALQSAP